MAHGLSRRTSDSANARRVALLALLCASALPAAALAQTTAATPAAPAAAADSPTRIGEIIVTAQKRSENVQSVPVSITVIQPSQLTAAGVHNFQDLANVAPSLGVSASGNGQNSSVEMRGVGAFSFSYLTEPDVAILIDDVPVASQSQAFSNLSDVAQIEVLRGPQTTLFGKSASAGVVSITTEKPSSVFGGKVSVSGTGDGEETVDASVTGPITDNLLFRLTGSLDDFRGNVKNLYNGDWTNGENTYSFRGKLRWTPTSKLTIDATASYTDATGSLGLLPVPVEMSPTTKWETLPPTAASFYQGININRSNSTLINDTPPVLNYDIASGSVKVAYDLGWSTLLSITSYSDYKTYNDTDFDWTALNILGLSTNGAQNGGLSQVFNEETKQTTQEFRLVSGPGAFRYVAGLWYADKDDYYTTVRGPYYPGLGTHLYANYTYTDESTQYAAYGQSEWDIFSKLTLVTGLRLNQERIAYDLDNPYKSYLLNGSHVHGVVTGKISLEYHPVQNINLFASYTRGYKGETYDITSSFTPLLAAKGPVQPETSNSYELGVKSQFFERRLTLNVTAFDTDYTNFQAQTIVPGLGNGFVLANVGSLRTRGLELDGRAILPSGFNIGFGLDYLDAVITSFPDGQCYYGQPVSTVPGQGCYLNTNPSINSLVWNLAGKSLPNAPRWKGTINVQYTHDIPNTGFSGSVNLSAKYQSLVNYSLSPDPQTVQPGYATANIDFGIQPISGPRYKVNVFIDNIFDTHYYNGLTDYSAFNTPNTFGFVPRDFRRYAGARLTYSF